MIRAIFTICLLAGVATASNAADSLLYGPATVELTGTLVRQTFPGPPNYASLKTDKRELYWVLRLERPVDVIADEGAELNETERGVRYLQLLLDSRQYQEHKGLVGKQVVITGTLFHAISGHHHTPVLLTVLRLRAKVSQ